MQENNNNFEVIPISSYLNSEQNKSLILKENKNKSGIYRWNNLITGKSYIGSSISLSNRFNCYYSLRELEKRLSKGKSIIYNTILKHGHSNFSLDILEYCKPNILIKREQYYIDLLKPEYNICKVAGSTLGLSFNHSEATKVKLSTIKTGIKHNISFSINLSKAKRGKKINKPKLNIGIIPKVITSKTKMLMSLRSRGINVKVFDKRNNLINEFPTIKSAALHFGIHPRTISNIFKTGISYDNYVYKFEVKDIKIRVYDNNKLISTLDNLKKASTFYNIPPTTMYRYIKSGKLYKNKLLFVSGNVFKQ